MSYYPIVFIPDRVQNALCAVPSKPVIDLVSHPGKQPQPVNQVSILALAALTLSLFKIPVLFVLGLVVSGIYTWWQWQSYPSRLKEWETLSKRYERSQLVQSNIDQEYEKSLSLENLTKYRIYQLSKALQETTPTDGTHSKAVKGKSEHFFSAYLNRYFSGKIHVGLTLTIPGYSHPYTPDFTYREPDLNLHIDIEIDEPYTYEDGKAKPIHYQQCRRDERRNNFFLDRGWLVVRFAEEQVCRYPDSCCKQVANLLSKMGMGMPEQLTNVPDLPHIKHWTEAEARQMAIEKTRNKYLPPD